MLTAGHSAQEAAHHVPSHRSSDIYADIIHMPNGMFGLHVRDKFTGLSTVDAGAKKGTAAEFLMQRVHQRHVGGVVLRLHTDIDVSMLTKELRQYIKAEGIILVPAAPYDSSGHGFVERPHSDMWALMRCNLLDYYNTTGESLPMIFYQWALQHAIAGINCAPRGAETQSPYELEYDRKPHYDHYMSFGQPVSIQVLPKPADKSIPRGHQGYHVGMTEGSESLHLVLLT
jgi:hypothetical protein